MLDYIVDNRGELAYLYAAVILGLVFTNMAVKGWKGAVIRYSVGVFALACVVNAAPFIRDIF